MVELDTMPSVQISSLPRVYEVRSHRRADLAQQLPRFSAYIGQGKPFPLSRHPAWLVVLERGMRHVPYCLEVVEGDQTRGILALAYVQSLLFGRFLVSLPYLNYGGVIADDNLAARLLIDHAIQLADQLEVRYLELRHESVVPHAALMPRSSPKYQMRLPLPPTAGQLWDQLPATVRNRVRKAQKNGLTVGWGGQELLRDFYAVFSRNMRDLGTPVYSCSLFRGVLEQLPERAEFCVVRAGTRPVAAALLLHGWGISEVPSASSVRCYNHTNANMLMYWHMLERAIQRRQAIFDFGRCSPESGTFRFKKQWGAIPKQAEWQVYARNGCIPDLSPANPRFDWAIRLWRRLPLCLARLIGPRIVRGIP